MAEGPDKASQAKVEFEATLINSFVGELLPKDAGTVFGEGSAGDMWRSMLSEQVSRQIAKSGALGLSRRVFATHELVPSCHGEKATAAADAAEMSANILSGPSGATFDNGGVLFAGRKRG
jgi:Rod binding domain-containing protein